MNYLVTLIKRVGGYLAEITISEALEIVTCHWGRWVSEEDVTISKQTFRVELYPLRRPSGQQFCNMVMLFFKPSPQNTQWATILEHGHVFFWKPSLVWKYP